MVQSPLFRWEQALYFIWKPRRKGEEVHSPSCLKSSVKFPQSVMIWGAMSSAGVGPLCFLKTKASAPVYQVNPAGFGTCPLCQKHQKLVKWSWCWCAWLASKLTRPEPHIENLWVLSRGKWETRDQKMQMSWRPLSKKPGLLYHLSSATNWSPPCHARIEAVIKAKGAPTKYWVHIQ